MLYSELKMSNVQVEPEVYAFNERGKPESIIDSAPYQLLLKVKAGTATQEDKDRIFDMIQTSFLYGKKRIALMGNYVDFSKWLKCYWVKFKDGDIREYWAFNKSNIRKNRGFTGVLKIVEIK